MRCIQVPLILALSTVLLAANCASHEARGGDDQPRRGGDNNDRGRQNRQDPPPFRESDGDRNPFLDLADALAGRGSLFNGPDRGGQDTLHGELANHWFRGYKGLDLYRQGKDQWPEISIPSWRSGQPPTKRRAVTPNLPQMMEDLGDLYMVRGMFLVGVVKWPHEEYLEKYVSGELKELNDSHKIPCYWLVQYRLYIPKDYAKNPNSDRNGKALIVYGKGGDRAGDPKAMPPWLNNPLSMATNIKQRLQSWSYHAGAKSALRLGVPVMQISEMPELKNTWNASANPQEEGLLGYFSEGLADFAPLWAAQSPNGDPVRDHPQFMYAASYIRARTFLDGFFNPKKNGTEKWSLWDEITKNDTRRYTPITSAIIEGGSKRGHATWIAAIADPNITGIISNGMANLHMDQMHRLVMDEKWETNIARFIPAVEMSGQAGSDPDQLRPRSGMQSSIDAIRTSLSGSSEAMRVLYDLEPIFRERNVMQDARHPKNPLPEIWVFNTQGMQDPFWPRQAWRFWKDDGIFHGDHQYYDFDPFALHPPFYPEFSPKMHGFAEAVWFDRPMPTARMIDLEYILPLPGETPQMNQVPLKIRGLFTIPRSNKWTIKKYGNLNRNDPQNFQMRLCVGLRPLSAETGRGMWSDKPKKNKQTGQYSYGRQTPWWEIPPIPGSVKQVRKLPNGKPVPNDVIAYIADFEFVSNEYASVNQSSPYFPVGFESLTSLDMARGVPEGYHVAMYVRCAVEHEPSVDREGTWPVRGSSMIEFLPPWRTSPMIGGGGRNTGRGGNTQQDGKRRRPRRRRDR